jgi:hypothetical protein
MPGPAVSFGVFHITLRRLTWSRALLLLLVLLVLLRWSLSIIAVLLWWRSLCMSAALSRSIV